MDYKYCISCVFQDYHKDHDVIEEDEKDNIETLHWKMVVMSGTPIYSSPCELMDALNMETYSICIILNSFIEKDEVCFSSIHPSELCFLAIHLFELFSIALFH